MSASPYLSVTEFASLRQVGGSIAHDAIPEGDGLRLLDLCLVYRLLGNLRITTAGRMRIARGY